MVTEWLAFCLRDFAKIFANEQRTDQELALAEFVGSDHQARFIFQRGIVPARDRFLWCLRNRYESIETDWRNLVARDDIDLIDICTPNYLHHDIAVAAAEAGKMIVCEKPLAMNYQEAMEMTTAVEKAGVANMVAFNTRRFPSVALAKQLVDENRVGRPFHYNVTYNQDYTISPDIPQGGEFFWRLDAKMSGSGVTGDLLAHTIDTAEWLNGPISGVFARTKTFVPQRTHVDSNKNEPVTIDDACLFIAEFANGSLGTFQG